MVNHVRDVRNERTFVKHVDNVRSKYDHAHMNRAQTTGQVLIALKDRSNLSLDEIAKRGGYKGRSSVQAYFNAEYASSLSPTVAKALAQSLAGKGEPPIHSDEIYCLMGIDPNAIPIRFEGASSARPLPDLPIYGTGLGAPLIIEGAAIEQTTLNTGEIIGYAKRPSILHGRNDVYALYIQGSSMYPAHGEGDMIAAERRRPPRTGDDVVIYLRSNGNGDDEDDGERARGVIVKRLVRTTANYLELEQFTPPMIFRVEIGQVVQIDRVLTMADLLS